MQEMASSRCPRNGGTTLARTRRTARSRPGGSRMKVCQHAGRYKKPPDSRESAFLLVSVYVEPPAGVEPATHPYHGSAAKRRAIRRLRSSDETVGAAVLCSVADRLVEREESPQTLITKFTKVNLAVPTWPVISQHPSVGKMTPLAWKPRSP